jgi:hypothetical protein
MLAQTYDPHMLASWETRGVLADPAKARVGYEKALRLGEQRAQEMLRLLRGEP